MWDTRTTTIYLHAGVSLVSTPIAVILILYNPVFSPHIYIYIYVYIYIDTHTKYILYSIPLCHQSFISGKLLILQQKYTWDLFGGLEHFLFFHILGISSSQLTFIFFRRVGIPPTRWAISSNLWKIAMFNGKTLCFYGHFL